MKQFSNIIFSLLILTSSSAFAGNEKGNGGDALICLNEDQTVRSIEFFDLFETREIYGKDIDLGATSLNIAEKIALLTNHLARRFPKLAAEFSEHARTFIDRSVFTDSDLEDIPDAGNIIFPRNCGLKQAIIRGQIAHAPGKMFLINSKIWANLDATSQLAAISHEFFYGIAVDRYLKSNSVEARRLNAEFLSNPASSPSELFVWTELFKKLGLGFSENWGDSSKIQITEDNSRGRKILYAEATPSAKLPSTRFGVIEIAGQYRLNYEKGTEIVRLSGSLVGPHFFKTEIGDWGIDTGSMSENNGVEDALEIRGQGLTWPTLPLSLITMEFSSRCDKFGGGVKIREASTPDDWAVEIGGANKSPDCRLTVTAPAQKIVASAAKNRAWSFSYSHTRQGDDYRFVLEPDTLEWQYGSYPKINTDRVIFSPRGAETLGSSEIGLYPEVKRGNMVIKNIPIKKIEFDRNGALEKLEPANKPVKISVRDGLSLEGVIGGLLLNYRDGPFRIFGDFTITEFRGFSSDYIGLKVDDVFADSLVLRNLPKAHFVKSERVKQYRNYQTPISFDESYEPQSWEIPFTAEGPLRIRGGNGLNEIEAPLEAIYGLRMDLTWTGFMHFRRWTLENAKYFGSRQYRIGYRAYMRPEGLFVDDITYGAQK